MLGVSKCDAKLRNHWWLLLIVSVLTLLPTRAANDPHWGAGGSLLSSGGQSGREGLSFFPEISPDGRFVVSRFDTYEPRGLSENTYDPGGYSGSRLYVWDTREFELDNALTQPAPVTNLDVSVVAFPPDFAISPDERYVAIQADDELRVLSLPQLELQQSIPTARRTSYRRVLDWSPDRRFLGALFGSEIIVWDAETNDVYRNDIGYSPVPNDDLRHPSLAHMDNGWLVSIIDEARFLHCGWRLDQCTSYEFAGLWYVVGAPNGSVVLAKRQSPPVSDAIVGVWTGNEGGNYELSDNTLGSEMRPEAFSPTSRYLVIRREGDERVIFDYSTLTPIHMLQFRRPPPTLPAWLSGDEYFVTLTSSFVLSLYQVGRTEPIETLDLVPTYQSMDFQNLTLWEDVTVSVDARGRWVLIGFSNSALVVPIVYE